MIAAAAKETKSGQQGWQASLDLGFSEKSGRTVLSTFRHRGPLTVQRPFYPEGHPCHVYILHPPGGVVGGDRLAIAASSKAGGHGLATTPGAGKFYRSCGPSAEVVQKINVAAGSALEWFPQEAIIFDGARCSLHTEVSLEGGADFLGWDILCFGRPASRDYFLEGVVSNRLQISRDGVPLLIERLSVESGEDLLRPSGQRGCTVAASFIAANCTATILENARDCLAANRLVLCGATLIDDLLVVRCLGDSVEEIRTLFIEVWQKVRPVLLGREACLPRIWAT